MLGVLVVPVPPFAEPASTFHKIRVRSISCTGAKTRRAGDVLDFPAHSGGLTCPFDPCQIRAVRHNSTPGSLPAQSCAGASLRAGMGVRQQRSGPNLGAELHARSLYALLAPAVALAVLVPAMPAQAAQTHAQPVAVVPMASPAPRPAVKLTGLALAQRHTRARIRVVNYARAQRGDRYLHGAEGPSRFDCSGLTLAAYRTVGKRLPHSARQQAGLGRRVSARDARAGDLVAYGTHVGVLVSKGRMVDAPGRGRRVLERNIYGNPQYRRVIS